MYIDLDLESEYGWDTGRKFDYEHASLEERYRFDKWASTFLAREAEQRRRLNHQNDVTALVNRDRSMLASMSNIVGCDNDLVQMIIDTDYEPHDDNIYRVYIEGRKAEVVCLGLDSVDAKCQGEYYVSKLPKWIQNRLAILLMLDSKSPSGVEGVGVRLGRNKFWVFKDGNKSLFPDTSSHGD